MNDRNVFRKLGKIVSVSLSSFFILTTAFTVPALAEVKDNADRFDVGSCNTNPLDANSFQQVFQDAQRSLQASIGEFSQDCLSELASVTDESQEMPYSESLDGAMIAMGGLQSQPDSGPFNITGTDGQELTANDYNYINGVLTITSTTPMTIENTDATASTTDRIIVGGGTLTAGDTVNLTFAGVNIDRSNLKEDLAAVEIVDDAAFNVTITLSDTSNNSLKGCIGDASIGQGSSPGIQKNGIGNVGMLTITGSTGESAGILTVSGGPCEPAIGGSQQEWGTRNITINGGHVKATGGEAAAGIGGGYNTVNVSYIYINGGIVEATSGNSSGKGSGAGIGSGVSNSDDKGNVDHIYITGGKITAISDGRAVQDNDGAGIGSGGCNNGAADAPASDIHISGGDIIAIGAWFGAGIGGGSNRAASNITVSGGNVMAIGGQGAAGIGGGGQSAGENIQISGGAVKAIGGLYQTYPASAIGGGALGTANGNSLNGDAVVLAARGTEIQPALDGFVDGTGKSTITHGLIFTGLVTNYTTDPVAIDWKTSDMYGDSLTITEDTELPANTTLAQGKTLTLSEGKTLTIPAGVSFTNDGTLNLSGTLVCEYNEQDQTTGEVDTLTNFYLDGSEDIWRAGYQTYQTYQGIQPYKDLPDPNAQDVNAHVGESIDATSSQKSTAVQNEDRAADHPNWYFINDGGIPVAIQNGDPVILNQHTFYENLTHNIVYEVEGEGTLEISSSVAAAGETITVQSLPQAGYKLQDGSLVVQTTTATVPVSDLGNGTFSFVMPAGDVSVHATFVVDDGGDTAPVTPASDILPTTGDNHHTGTAAFFSTLWGAALIAAAMFMKRRHNRA